MDSHISDLTAIALVATAAVLCGLILTRLRQPAIVGYILAGMVLGPTGLGLVENSEDITLLAELGVLMLLFLIGMELSLRAFTAVLRIAISCALLQIALALAVTFGFAALLDWTAQQALLFGFLVALSSTAVAIKMLDDIGELRTETGRITVGVLIAQDLAVVPMLVLVRAMGDSETLGFGVVVKMVVAVGLLTVLISYLSRRNKIVLPTHRWMKGKTDLIPLAAIAFCFLAATLTGLFGLSAAYGAFLAGLVISASTDRKAVMRATHPIQSVLVVVFFLSIGLLIDLRYLVDNLGTVLGFLAAAILIKTVINVGVLRLLGAKWEHAFPAGVVMGQLGEFSFVLAAAGVSAGAIDQEGYRLAISVIALSLLISPLWLLTARRFDAIASDGISSMRQALRQVYDRELTWLERLGLAARTGGRALVDKGRVILKRVDKTPRSPKQLPSPQPTPKPDAATNSPT